MYGYHPNKGLEPKQEYVVEAIGDFVQRINEAHETAKKALEQSNILMKNQYDKHKKPAIDYINQVTKCISMQNTSPPYDNHENWRKNSMAHMKL